MLWTLLFQTCVILLYCHLWILCSYVGGCRMSWSCFFTYIYRMSMCALDMSIWQSRNLCIYQILQSKYYATFTKVSYVFHWNIDFFTHNNDFTQIYSSIPEHWLGCCSSSSNVLLNYRIDVFVTLRGPRFFLFRWNSFLFHSLIVVEHFLCSW